MKKQGKLLQLMLVPVVIVSLVLTIGCKSSGTTTTTQVTVTAERGDISLEITAVGNLDYATEEELSFDTGGTVSEVLVDVGDTVTKGQVLAKLDLTEYTQNITSLESALSSKQLALVQANQNLTTVKRQVASKQQAVVTAQRNLDDANYNLIIKERAVVEAQLNITSAELAVKQAQYAFETNTGGTWAGDTLSMKKAQLELTKLSLSDAERNVESAKDDIADAQLALENAQLDVVDTDTSVTIAEAKVVSAQQDVTNAQQALDDAKATSPEIIAPFDGLITVKNTVAGSEVYKGGAIVTIVDPDKFKADISVGETDISNVTLSGDATVEFDAITGIVLPAKVISISPTATTSSGVVSYVVEVEIDSTPEAILQSQQSSNQSGSAAFPGGMTLPSGFTPGGTPPAGMTPPAGFTPGQAPSGSFTAPNQSGQAQSGTSTTVQSVTLRQGLTTTVNIIYQQANNAVLIPIQAISTKGDVSTVSVIKDGVISERNITTGITSSKYTEVTGGLSEGEQVVYYRVVSSTETTTTTTNRNQQQGMFGGGGMPGGGMPGGGGPPGGP